MGDTVCYMCATVDTCKTSYLRDAIIPKSSKIGDRQIHAWRIHLVASLRTGHRADRECFLRGTRASQLGLRNP